MTDREDFYGGRPPPVVCKGSFVLGTACGACSRCRTEIASMTKMFKVKAETLGPNVVANFRVKDEVHLKLKSMAEASGVSIQDVVRQMIDFSLEHS